MTSYFPLEWDWVTRQEQCQEQYGFACTCPRCQVRGASGGAGAAQSLMRSTKRWMCSKLMGAHFIVHSWRRGGSRKGRARQQGRWTSSI